MRDSSNVVRAIAAHAKWKFYLRQAIETGTSEWTVAEVRPDNQCEFGKWLLALPRGDRDPKHWDAVRQLHAEFHEEAAEVLKMLGPLDEFGVVAVDSSAHIVSALAPVGNKAAIRSKILVILPGAPAYNRTILLQGQAVTTACGDGYVVVALRRSTLTAPIDNRAILF